MNNAQGAIEYLLIIGAAVIIAVIVIALMMSLSGQGTGAVEESGIDTAYDDLKEKSGGYVRINGEYFTKGSSVAKGIVASYHFEGDTTDEMLLDSSGNENNLKFTAQPLAVSTGFSGGKAFTFPGTSGLTTVAPVSWKFTGNPTKSFSVSAWFKPNPCVDYGGISLANGSWFRLAIYVNQGWWTQLRPCSHVDCGYSPAGKCDAGVWQNIVGVYSASDNKLYTYQNGKLVSTRAPNTGTSVDTSSAVDSLNIGNAQAWFKGEIDEIIIWGKALSESEVKQLYEGN